MSSTANDFGSNLTGKAYVDGLIWGSSWNMNTNFGGAAGTLTYSFDPGLHTFQTWEKNAFREAIATIETIIPVDYVEVPSGNPGSIYAENFRYALVPSNFFPVPGVAGAHGAPGSKLLTIGGKDTLYGLFSYDSFVWTPASLQKGGQGFETIMHEMLHGLGIAHPHDNGGTSSVFPGVSSSFGDYGTDGQNQGVYTIMSYNAGHPTHIQTISTAYGHSSTPMALDIAALQAIYGTKAHNTGNNVYTLDDINKAGTSWSCIWDTGGTDTISAQNANRGVYINLNDADLTGSDAGGIPSYANGIIGGFTIANGVKIENAIGGNRSDVIGGNELGNQISGNGGNDTLRGNGGNDTLRGGSGHDNLLGGTGSDSVYGDSGHDKLYASTGNDFLQGGAGLDWYINNTGTRSSVNLNISTAQNTGLGNDTIQGIENLQGGTASDVFIGTGAANILKGAKGKDHLFGKAGEDHLIGGLGDDIVNGGANNDTLYGQDGQDFLVGEQGRDKLFGGQGADHFVFKDIGDSASNSVQADVIRDFKSGVDKINLRQIDASTVLSGDNSFTFDGQRKTGTDDEGEIYFRKSVADNHTLVYIDNDNDTDVEMVIRLIGLHNLTADDFIL